MARRGNRPRARRRHAPNERAGGRPGAPDSDSGLAATLTKMNQEAAETETRCAEVAANFNGKKTAITEEARTTKHKGTEMLKTYLDEDANALDGFEFLTMTEAAEVGHWNI